MDSLFVCPRCGNARPEMIGFINDKPYCRACIAFSGEEAEVDSVSDGDPTLKIDYRLSQEQLTLSADLLSAYRSGRHVLIHAVTGSGKTEVVFALIQEVISSHRTIGFAIPRRDVVIELFHRFKKAFPKLIVTAVYGGHHKELTGDLIILTTHQIYRYEQYFDVLIIDEYDAFPYRDNKVLEAFVTRSLKGPLVALTATPTEAMITRFSSEGHTILRLWTRYHKHPLPVPAIVRRLLFFKLDWLIDRLNLYRQKKQPALVFVPTIEGGRRLFAVLRLFCPGGANVSSKEPDRPEIIEAFRQGRYDYVVSTSILERGITLTNLQVIIYDAHHILYDAGTLIQMAGRVGRRKNAPGGDVIFLAIRSTKAMKEAIHQIEQANAHLQNLL